MKTHQAVYYPATYKRIAGMITGEDAKTGTLCGGYPSIFWNVRKQSWNIDCRNCNKILAKEPRS